MDKKTIDAVRTGHSIPVGRVRHVQVSQAKDGQLLRNKRAAKDIGPAYGAETFGVMRDGRSIPVGSARYVQLPWKEDAPTLRIQWNVRDIQAAVGAGAQTMGTAFGADAQEMEKASGTSMVDAESLPIRQAEKEVSVAVVQVCKRRIRHLARGWQIPRIGFGWHTTCVVCCGSRTLFSA